MNFDVFCHSTGNALSSFLVMFTLMWTDTAVDMAVFAKKTKKTKPLEEKKNRYSRPSEKKIDVLVEHLFFFPSQKIRFLAEK